MSWPGAKEKDAGTQNKTCYLVRLPSQVIPTTIQKLEDGLIRGIPNPNSPEGKHLAKRTCFPPNLREPSYLQPL